MRLLVDTHVLLWWLSDDPRLGVTMRDAIIDGANDVYFSSIAIAEIVIKQALGKLDAPHELLTLLAENGLVELALSARHSLALRDLPPLHRDPFDRMMVAQAQVEDLVVITRDTNIRRYAVRTMD